MIIDIPWSTYQRRDGQWVISYKDERSKKGFSEHRIPRDKAHTEKQAERYATTYLPELRKRLGERPIVDHVDEEAPTIASLCDDWLKLRDEDPKLSPSMRAQNSSNMKHHVLEHAIAKVPIAQLGSALLRDWVRHVRDHGKVIREIEGKSTKNPKAPIVRREPLAPMTTRNVVASLTQFFEDAMAEEWIDLPANPMRHPGVRKEIPEAETMSERRGMKRGEKAHLTRDAAQRLITCPNVPEARRVLYLVAMTSGGFRSGELYGATWSDVELDEKAKLSTINITKALATVGPDGWATTSKTKTKDSVRMNPLHHAAARALRAWKKAGWAQLVGRQPKPTDYIFPNAAGEAHRPNDSENLRDDLAAAELATTYGIESLTFRDATRHSFATWLGAAGVTDEVIGRLMGHSAKSVTRRHYVSDNLEALSAAIETIKLDLSTAQVIALPLAVGTRKEAPATVGPTAVFTADRGKPAAKRKSSRAQPRETNRETGSRFRDLNSRPTVYEVVA